MQSSVHSELNKSNNKDTNNGTAVPCRRRRRPRNRRRKQKRDDDKHVPLLQQNEESLQDQQQLSMLNLTDLTSEAHALEKQLAELQTQLKINYSNIPSKEQGRIASAIAAEQISTTEEEIGYVRNSLKKAYRQIFAVDLIYATTHHIEDKIWRYIFYAGIEEVRSKLRKIKSSDFAADDNHKALQKALFHRIDSAFKFYRELNNTVKSNYHIDTKVLGIDLFKQHKVSGSTEENIGILLQFNYICMGDLARYHAQQAMAAKSVKGTAAYWSLAKSCYLKAIDVYRRNGKPYSQLALVSISNGNAMDVVWYYCMSLAVKHPSSVGRDNLKSFYSKIRFNSKPKDSTDNITSLISQFVESFLHMHRTVMFSENDGEEFATMMPRASQLGTTLFSLISAEDAQSESDNETVSKTTQSLLHIIRTTLTRSITILMISVWIAGERLKDKANYHIRPMIVSSQIHMYTFVFILLTGVYRSSRQTLEQVKESLNPLKYQKLETMVDETLLPGLSIWSAFLTTNFSTIAQYCMTASNDTRNREPEKKTLVKSIQSLLSLLISHPSFPDPVLNVLPTIYPLSEDLSLLGVMPLASFHDKVDFFKENAYDVNDETSSEARKQVRWGRIRDLIKKIADSASFDFIQYNQTEQKYSVIDENAKRQQQGRFMKALATQRLMEQVSSLEKNVNRMTLQNKSVNEEQKQQQQPKKRDIYTCVVDVTAFLDGLNKVKKWANQTLNVDRRSQGSILEVIVPLEVIDSLDNYKKGTSHMNMQARDSIRYLDQKLLENSKKNDTPTSSFLRTQKVTERLTDWNESKAYWIGEESRSNVVDNLISDAEEEVEDTDTESEVNSDMSSDEDLLKPRRRRGDDSDESEDEVTSDSEQDESEGEENEETTTKTTEEVEELDYDEEFEDDDEEDNDTPYTYNDVPKVYRPFISCLLYYHSRQEVREDNQPERLVLVTNDEDLAWWAELFGNPKTGKRLHVRTVDEWDQMVGKLDFERIYDYS